MPAFIDPQAWQDLHDLALNGDPDAVEDMLRLPPAATNGSASFPTGFGNLSSAFGRSQIVPVSARVPQQQTSFNINDPANGGSLNSQIVTGAHTAAPPPPAVPHQPPMSSQVRNPAGPGIYAQRPTPYDEAPHATSDFLQPLSPSSNGGWNQPAAQLSDPTASPDLSGVTVTGGGAQRIADMLRLPSATGALSGSAVVQQAPGPNGSMTSQPVSADAIDAYLRSKNSPLVGEGADFMKWGQAYDLDPRLLVALAGSETTFGKKITRGDNNALNVLYNGPHSDFESVDHAIKGAAKSLNKPGSTYDLSNTASMYPDHYCRGKGCTDGLKI